jgi:hypothetical protein
VVAQGPGQKPSSKQATAKPVAATVAPKIDTRLPIFFIERTWKLAPERQQIMDHFLTLTDDALELRDESQFPEWFSVYIKTKGTGSKPLGTELVRLLQNPKAKIIVKPGTAGPASCDSNVVDGKLGVGLQLGSRGPMLFTAPSLPSTPTGTVVQACPWYIALAHELVHATHRARGVTKSPGNQPNKFFDEYRNEFTENSPEEEARTVGLQLFANERLTENSIRKEHGLNLRVSYASPELALNGQGVVTPASPPEWWPDYGYNLRYYEVTFVSLKVIEDGEWFSADWDLDYLLNGAKLFSEVDHNVNSGDVIPLGWTKKVTVWDGRVIRPEVKAGPGSHRDEVKVDYTAKSTPPWGEGTRGLTSGPKGLFEVQISIQRLPGP